ncbi:MAG: M48 family metallopeptidase, partial [Alphaproteobacteria bacterium]|nr:M48 family metallopeptidase [Alphaproteobacteria bacterium]
SGARNPSPPPPRRGHPPLRDADQHGHPKVAKEGYVKFFVDDHGDRHPWQIIESARRKRMTISVRVDGTITLRVPKATRKATIDRFVARNSPWLNAEIQKVRSHLATMHHHLLYLGRRIPIVVREQGRPKVQLEEAHHADGTSHQHLLVTGRQAGNIQNMVECWLAAQARTQYGFALDELWPLFHAMGFAHKPIIRIRRMRTRWGSLSLARPEAPYMSLNTALVQTPFVRAIVAHELCHLKHQHHQPPFYDLLSEVHPNWRADEKELRKFHHTLQPHPIAPQVLVAS